MTRAFRKAGRFYPPICDLFPDSDGEWFRFTAPLFRHTFCLENFSTQHQEFMENC
jgi:hypothetical protein